MSATGLADLALYEGRLSEGAEILKKAIPGDLANKNPGAAARKLSTLAWALCQQGRTAEALASAERAISLATENETVLFEVAQVYLEAGKESEALAIASTATTAIMTLK